MSLDFLIITAARATALSATSRPFYFKIKV
jgi:hypothetical protein